MRIRYKGYHDYGLTNARVEEILTYCREVGDSTVIEQAAEKANPVIAAYLAESLKNKISYEKLDAKYFMPCLKEDFYGYRRLTISLLNNMIPGNEEDGKWADMAAVD